MPNARRGEVWQRVKLCALAAAIGHERGYEAGWFNGGIKSFVSAQGDYTTANLPPFTNLKVMMAAPTYLLPMKCMAARVATPEATDVQDVKFLLLHLDPHFALRMAARRLFRTPRSKT